jgi:glycosyltransferase involved in cell wall biosynthesis
MKTLQAQTPATKKTLASPQTASLKLEAKRARGRKRDQEETELLGAQIVDRRGTAVGSRPVRLAPTISLCMIVKNEERVLDACLTSVKPYVDEIVLVDTGSTDRTVEIAQAHGVKLFHFPWINDFSAARNVSLEHATGDWLFWMDADDTLPEECGRRLHELVMLAEDKVTGFLMQVHIPPAQGEHGFTIVDHVKLFRNRPQHRFEGRIHEQILEAIYRQGGSIERSNLYVVHSGYDYSPEGQQRKRERDLTILELDLADRPTHPFVWFNIGMTAFHLKESEKAISALEQCLAFSKPHESIVRKVYAMLAGAHLEQRDMASARTRIDQGLALFPNDPELLFRAGIIYRELGNLPVAERNYLRLLNSRESGHIDSLDVSMTTYKAHHNLALIYQDMNQVKEAEEQWQAALAHSPDFAPSLLGLGELCLKLCRFDEARTVLERLSKVAPEQAEVFRRHLAQAEGLS